MPILPKSKILRFWKNWQAIEKKIREEIDWLRDNIETFGNKETAALMGCRECFLRKIAILIVSGQIKATQITKSPLLRSFWADIKRIPKKSLPKIHHGSDWHKEVMERIESHFHAIGYEVIREPNIYHGRADLGVYKKEKPDLFIEVGTTSLFKLWLNLEQMKKGGNFIYLIVVNDDKLIEFRGIKSGGSPLF